eukprot:scaffold115940_cov37-Tisochrysis_lutea.AAC.2
MTFAGACSLERPRVTTVRSTATETDLAPASWPRETSAVAGSEVTEPSGPSGKSSARPALSRSSVRREAMKRSPKVLAAPRSGRGAWQFSCRQFSLR